MQTLQHWRQLTESRPIFWGSSLRPVEPRVGPRVTHCGSHCAMQHDFKNGLLWFCLLCIQLCFVVLYCKCHWNRCSVTLRMVCCVVSSQSFVNEELLLSGSSIFSIFRLVSKVEENHKETFSTLFPPHNTKFQGNVFRNRNRFTAGIGMVDLVIAFLLI